MNKIINKKITCKREKSNNKLVLLSLVLIIFSNAVFRTEKNMRLLIFISVIICLYVVIRSMLRPLRISKTITNSFFLWFFIINSMYFFYGYFLTTYAHFDADFFLYMFIITLITMLLFIDFSYRKFIRLFINSCVYSSILVSIYVIFNEWSYILSGEVRIGESASGNVNTLAVFLGILLLPIAYSIIFDKKYIFIIPYSLSMMVSLLTGSKKAIIFIVLGIVILIILKYKFNIHKYIPWIISVIILLLFIFNNPYLYNLIGVRIIDFLGSIGFNIEQAQYSNSTTLRLNMYRIGVQAFLEKPLFGGGWFYFSNYSNLGTYSHNNYIELLTTYGVFGFTLYYGMIAMLMINLIKLFKKDNYSKMFFTILIIILVNDFAAVTFSFNILNYIVMMFSYLYIKKYYKESNNQINIM